jgi:hypothetical protein
MTVQPETDVVEPQASQKVSLNGVSYLTNTLTLQSRLVGCKEVGWRKGLHYS